VQSRNNNTAFLVIAAAVVLIAVAFVAFSIGRNTVGAGGSGSAQAPQVPSVAKGAADEPAAQAPSAQQPAAQAQPAAPQQKQQDKTDAPAPSAKQASDEQANAPPEPTTFVIRNQTIYALDGSVAYRGDIDLRPTFARLEAGERDRHRNDGSTFGNREGRLPRKARGYYTEWVIRTKGLREVGPQRLVTGKDGEAYYTPDHYETFVRVR
jgi:ribonuclease T1